MRKVPFWLQVPRLIPLHLSLTKIFLKFKMPNKMKNWDVGFQKYESKICVDIKAFEDNL